MSAGAVAGRLALVLVSVGLCLGVFEGAARLMLGPPAATYFTPAYRDVETDFDVQYAANPDGSRAADCSPADAARPVVLIGDSFAFGQGVPQGRELASLLACADGVPVRNLGSIGQDFLYYEAAQALIPGDARAVILLLFENDLPPAGWESLSWRLKRELYRRSQLVLLVRKVLHNMRDRVHADEIAGFTVDGRLNNPKTVIATNPGFFHDLAQPAPEQLAALTVAINDFATEARRRAPGAKILVAMAPEASSLSEGHRAFYRSLGEVDLPPARHPTAIYEAARLACAGQCRFVDLYPALAERGGADYFPHDFHWNADGHKLVADILRQELAR